MIHALVTTRKRGHKRRRSECILDELVPACNPRLVFRHRQEQL
jgi:hypothetical protein